MKQAEYAMCVRKLRALDSASYWLDSAKIRALTEQDRLDRAEAWEQLGTDEMRRDLLFPGVPGTIPDHFTLNWLGSDMRRASTLLELARVLRGEWCRLWNSKAYTSNAPLNLVLHYSVPPPWESVENQPQDGIRIHQLPSVYVQFLRKLLSDEGTTHSFTRALDRERAKELDKRLARRRNLLLQSKWICLDEEGLSVGEDILDVWNAHAERPLEKQHAFIRSVNKWGPLPNLFRTLRGLRGLGVQMVGMSGVHVPNLPKDPEYNERWMFSSVQHNATGAFEIHFIIVDKLEG